MQAISRGFSPVVSLLSASTDFILRVLGAQNPQTQAVTEEEVMIMLEEGTEIGVFKAIEHDMLKRVLRLADRKVSTMMTHRTDVIWLDLEDPTEKFHQEIKTSQHSRLPVSQGSLDELLGILEVRDYLSRWLNDALPDIQSNLQKPLFVPEAMTALELLEQFKQTRNHLAIVVDEFGGVTGIITTTDVLESIVGSLPVPGETEEPEAIQREDGSWLIDGTIPIEELKDLLDIVELPDEEDGNYETLGGLIMEQLGRIPTTGDYFEGSGLRFEVVDMDGHRVDKVLVSFVEINDTP
jgi:putative hemolysin